MHSWLINMKRTESMRYMNKALKSALSKLHLGLNIP